MLTDEDRQVIETMLLDLLSSAGDLAFRCTEQRPSGETSRSICDPPAYHRSVRALTGNGSRQQPPLPPRLGEERSAGPQAAGAAEAAAERFLHHGELGLGEVAPAGMAAIGRCRGSDDLTGGCCPAAGAKQGEQLRFRRLQRRPQLVHRRLGSVHNQPLAAGAEPLAPLVPRGCPRARAWSSRSAVGLTALRASSRRRPSRRLGPYFAVRTHSSQHRHEPR